ncbi:MAG: hypothetical protein UT66_C0004G0035 [candidate division CPR2 bacterium GW2011_GWC1_39_9]|uniref:Peptidase MA-like domain-containing protein n=1 Tax=candidate division CPR2 bacterium GW2011_GWC2_39_10 TaxID=1618345 RepID=A0A0G0LV61_UNCC2|nr:MAG: hypothetical protein UT18_C0006G0015 [candidate division CPR2 bacterium GW2011_GWC2_39_10]KKR36040.1 MAG: hypothetical protein UT66_C0004G0035 [candidate division CPR2 bacterium GW2011_GWC1_39_9]
MFTDFKQENLKKLEAIAIAIENVVDERWDSNDKINIYIGACPIAPRFVKSKSMILPYKLSNSILLNWATHEMIHFLYFKKWQNLFPKHNYSNFESPDPAWSLSEILVAIIGNNPRIKNIAKSEFNIYDRWKEIKLENKTLTEIFTAIYNKSDNFDNFLRQSWNKFNLNKLLNG